MEPVNVRTGLLHLIEKQRLEAGLHESNAMRMPTQQREICRRCDCRQKWDFTVPDELWRQVVPAELQGHVVCLDCFDELAYEKKIEYHHDVNLIWFAGDQASFQFKTVFAAGGG